MIGSHLPALQLGQAPTLGAGAGVSSGGAGSGADELGETREEGRDGGGVGWGADMAAGMREECAGGGVSAADFKEFSGFE
jgi:hypothetical protein